MFVIVDDRPAIAAAIACCFERECIAAVGIGSAGFDAWINNVSGTDLAAIEAVLIGSIDERETIASFVFRYGHVPVIAIVDVRTLRETLELFESGVSDVVSKPFHVREILARVAAIRRRGAGVDRSIEIDGIKIFSDGQDPQIQGITLQLPRRERRILEYLIANRGGRLTKSQLFDRVYGVFNDGIRESVIECHISRLRKRLKERLGYDPIDSQRFLGYRFVSRVPHAAPLESGEWLASLAQGAFGSPHRGALSGPERLDGTLAQ